MSFNSVLKKSHKVEFDLLKEFLERKKANISLYTSKEELLNQHSQFSSFKDYKELLESKISYSNAFKQLDLSNQNIIKEYFDLKMFELQYRTEDLTNSIVDYSQQVEFKKLSIQSKLNELKQKLESLLSFDVEKKFSIKENFFNMYNLSFQRNMKTALSVDTVAKVLTLPIKETHNVGIKKIYISKQSKGIPGNYNTGTNKLVYNIINKNIASGFEFFKVGKGPVKLVLIMEFDSEQIINEFQISRTNNFISTNFKINNMSFESSTNGIVNLKNVIDTNHQSLNFDDYLTEDTLVVKHLPVYAERVTLELESNEFKLVDDIKIFSIYLRELKFLRNTYQIEGEISSTKINTQPNLFLLNANVNQYPKENSAYETEFKLSENNGAEFEKLNFIKDKSETKILNGESKELVYKINLKKDEDKFRKLNSYSNEEFFVSIDTILNTFTKDVSPISYNFDQKQIDNSLKVFQPNLANRSFDSEKLSFIKEINNNGVSSFRLPINLNEFNIDYNDLILDVNEETWSRVQSLTELEFSEEETNYNKYFLDIDGHTIVINNTLNRNLVISYALKPIVPTLIKKPEGYYVRINEIFDYDKKNIKLKSIVFESDKVEYILKLGNKRHFLKHNYIDVNSLKIKTLVNNSWVELTSDQFIINNTYGILYYEATNETRISYRYYNIEEIDKNDFEVWSQDNRIKGIYIKPDSITFKEITESIDNQNTNYYLFDGSYSDTRNTVAYDNRDNTFLLSNTNIVEGSVYLDKNFFGESVDFEEIDFIDGYSEFLGLEKIEKDYIPSLQVSNENTIKFTIREIPYRENQLNVEVYDILGDEISTSSIGIEDRVVTITFAENLRSKTLNNYYVSYWYQNKKTKNTKRFSVDYSEGILYTSEDIQNIQDKNITYNVGRLGLEYSLMKEVEDLIVNKRSIDVYTEGLSSINNSIKFIWFKNKDNLNLSGLENFFSPLIYSIDIGMK